MRACQFFLLHLFFYSFQLRAFLTQTVAVYSSQLFLSYRAYGSLLHSHSPVVPLLLPHCLKKGSVHTGGCGAFSLCSLLNICCSLGSMLHPQPSKQVTCVFPTNITSFVVHGTTLSCGGVLQINWVFTLQHWLPSMIPLPSFLKSSV